MLVANQADQHGGGGDDQGQDEAGEIEGPAHAAGDVPVLDDHRGDGVRGEVIASWCAATASGGAATASGPEASGVGSATSVGVGTSGLTA